MKTVMIDILQDEVMNLLKDLEAMNVIKLHDANEDKYAQHINAIKSYKGTMTKQPIEEIDKQLKELRG